MYIAAQVFGIGAMISLFMIYQQKKRKNLITAKLCADVFWTLHYLCLGGIAGMIPNFVGIFREVVFINREKKKWADKLIWPIIFIGFSWCMGIYFYKSVFDILPIAASTFVTISLWVKNPRLTKLITLPVCIAFIIYDVTVGSYIGIINESLSIISIIMSFIRERVKSIKNKNKQEENVKMRNIFTEDITTKKEAKIYGKEAVRDYAAKIEADAELNNDKCAIAFAEEIINNKVGDFEKDGIDKMCHVSTFICVDDTLYISYYANTENPEENPDWQVARLAYAPKSNPEQKTILDIQAAGDELCGRKIVGVYDTILMTREDEPNNIYVLWTANADGKYYRFYRIFNTETKTLGEICVNRFKVGEIVNDFSSSGMEQALAANDIGYKEFFSDIGIMQKLSSRIENGERYYYTGAYSGNFTCIIKSKDLIEWEYVAQPNEGANGTGFINETKWENAVYVIDNEVFYFVRQWDPVYEDEKLKEGSVYGILTKYNLDTKEWAKPVLVGDCQSRSDFIIYNGGLYLFYAPTNREHIGILKIDTENLAKSEVVLQADMKGSCFYPYIQYYDKGELAMSYTVDRKHIRLAKFTLSKYIK